MLQLEGVRRCFLLDVNDGSSLLSSNASGSRGGRGGGQGALGEPDFGPFLRQCWGTIFEYAKILISSDDDDDDDAEDEATMRRKDGDNDGKGGAGGGGGGGGFLGLVFDAGPLGVGGGLASSVTLALQAVSLGKDRPACLVLVYLSGASAAEETRAAARAALAKATRGLSGGGNGGGGKRGGGGGICSGGGGKSASSGRPGSGSRRTAVRQLPPEREQILLPANSNSNSDSGSGSGNQDAASGPGLALSGDAAARLQSEELEALPRRFRTQAETLRQLYYPSSFALRPDPAAAGLPLKVARSLAAVGRGALYTRLRVAQLLLPLSPFAHGSACCLLRVACCVLLVVCCLFVSTDVRPRSDHECLSSRAAEHGGLTDIASRAHQRCYCRSGRRRCSRRSRRYGRCACYTEKEPFRGGAAAARCCWRRSWRWRWRWCWR